MIISDLYQRTLRLRFGQSEGTGFLSDFSGRQYLVTAKHVVNNISNTGEIDIYVNGGWKSHEFQLTGLGNGSVDIAVLALQYAAMTNMTSNPTMAGLAMGQDVYFLGFPYGMSSELESLGLNIPIPLVRKGCLSSHQDGPDGAKIMLIDGHNNPGFSGGPVVFGPMGPFGPSKPVNIAGVISGYRFNNEPIYKGDHKTGLTYRYNTGIVVAYGIVHAQRIAESNPNGAELPSAAE